MSTPNPNPFDHYWEVVVHVEGGATVTHTFSFESDARYYLAEVEGHGYTADLVQK